MYGYLEHKRVTNAPFSAVDVIELNELDKKMAGFDDPTVDGYRNRLSTEMLCIHMGTIMGKIEYTIDRSGTTATLHWIVSDGMGKLLLDKFHRVLHERGVAEIRLVCSLSESERPQTVLRRLNFYTRYGYRAVGIKFVDEEELTTNVKLRLVKRLYGRHRIDYSAELLNEF